MLAASAAVLGNPVNISYLEGQAPVAPDAITAYGPDLFGDKINLFNGALEFEHTDLSLPGNNAIPVALVRKHIAGRSQVVRGQFDDWDLEAPRIGGSFSNLSGWVTSSGGTNRCSAFSLPPAISSSTFTAGGSAPPPGSPPSPQSPNQPPSPTPGGLVVGFIATNYWQGTRLHIPGQGSQEVLLRSGTYSAAPTDGAIYPLVTHQNWQISCLPSIQNGAGEGFLAVSPQGLRYRFDWMATGWQTDVKKAGASIARKDMYLMATQVSDRFGNWVRYTYDSANPLLLTRIESNDGRVITITNSGGHAISATDGTRTFSYSYAAGGLSTVQQSDGSRWTFNLAPMVPPTLQTQGEGSTCDWPGDFQSDVLTGTITHPSGALGTFTTAFTLLGRTYVDRVCVPHPSSGSVFIGAVYPRYVNTQALTAKQITGPGLPTLNWSYQYSAPGGWTTCTTCSELRTITVTEPTGQQTRHLFGNRWRVNEGQLLQLDEGWNGSVALKSTSYRYRLPTGQNYPEQFGSSLSDRHDWLSSRHRPQDQRITTVQGNTFTWQVDPPPTGFDNFVRPRLVRKFSSLPHTRTEATEYDDNTTKWVMGELRRMTELTSGREVEWHSYHTSTAMRTGSSSFGKIVRTYSYNADGTLSSVGDAAGRQTLLSNHKRGKPQFVTQPDGRTESQVINNLGNSDSRTNAAGTTTTFGYDTMGRVASITYPGGDAAAYHLTTQAFEQVAFPEYGLAANHWRQTIATGNARTIRYFDGLWRERLELRYDTTNPGGTTSFEETRYDTGNRKSFESYAERSFTTLDAARAGRRTTYDAIDRVTSQVADSELGALTTTTQYPVNAFQRVVTNPRGFVTTFSFEAFDAPSEDSIKQIAAPESVSVSIQRDVFGKPTSIARAGGGNSATRNYVYDNYQRLCKTVEPESGAMVQDYDLPGNVAWRASGLTLTELTSCDQASVIANRKVNFGYDCRDRLTSTSYGDGSPSVARSYTADGLPLTITSGNFAWTLAYNNRRLMTAESLNTPQGAFAFGYGIDSHGNVASMVYPAGPTISYSPDALGRPTQVSGYLSGIGHHPNGQVSGYTTAHPNGIVHSVTQNLRGLPAQIRYTGVVQDAYAFDANGNVTGITDQQEGLSSRTMGYDGLDRLTAANGIWGTGAFGYDALDNVRSSRIGARTLTHGYDATNRLISVSGSINASIAYDANGNVINRAGQGFTFDIGNRLASATNLASYVYDGHGRRSWTQFNSGRTVLRIYSQGGRLLLTNDSQKGATKHIHLGDKAIAEVNSLTGTRWLHTDALGSPVATTGPTGAILERTRYEPYGLTAAGTNPDGIGFTGHVNDPETGLVYMQQRYQDPIAGRFLSVDPVVTDGKSGSFFSRYVYASNNPYKFNDPDGRAPSLIPDGDGGRPPLIGARNLDGSPMRHSISESRANLQAAREQLASNVSNGKAGEAATRANLGNKAAGEQVSFKTSDGTRTRTDFVTTDKGVVETKTGDAQLSKGQEKLKADISMRDAP